VVDCLKNNIICLVIHLHIYYTVVQTLSPFSFYYGFCKCSAVVIIFGARYTELLCNTTVIDLPTSPTCFCYTTMGKINLLFWDELKRFVSPCQSTELLLLKSSPLTSTWPHLRCDVGLVEGEYWKKILCYSIVYYYNGAQRYEPFLQVGQLPGILGFDLSWYSSVFRAPLCLWSSWCYI